MNELKGNSVLIVDDESSNIMTLTHILSPDYTVYAAKNGQKAIEAAEKYLPDVILLDILMPEMDGVEAARRIRALDVQEGAEVPIIAMTANVLMNEVEKYLEAGMTDHIGKPVDFDKLLGKLYKYLN